MGLTLWEVFLSKFKRNIETEEEEDEESNGFVPSPLDLSVRYAHGMPDAEIEREFHRITEQAREIEEAEGDT